MSADAIEVFVEVVDAGSFARAAARLDMPTTTVSARIARLEARLGTTLIQRTTRRLNVTQAGQVFYNHCVQALLAIAEGERALADAREEPVGPLRITAPSDLAQNMLTQPIERFLAAYPKTSIDLVVTNRKVDLVAEGIDLAVRAGPMTDSSLIVRAFRSGRVALFASPAYLARRGTPLTIADLSCHDLIRFSRMPISVPLRSASIGVAEIDFTGRLMSDDLETVRILILRGNGIGLLPEFLGGEQRDGLVRVLSDCASEVASVYFVYPAQRFVPRTVRAFIAMATES